MYQILTLLVVFGVSNGQFFHGGYVPTPMVPPVHPYLHQYLRSAYGSGSDDDVLRLLYSECSTAYRDYICDKRPSGFWEVWVAPSCQKYEKPAYPKPSYPTPAYTTRPPYTTPAYPTPPPYTTPAYPTPPPYTTPAYTRPPYTTPKPYMTPKPYHPPAYPADPKPYSLFTPERGMYPPPPSYGGSSGTKVAPPRDITRKDFDTCLKSFVYYYCDKTKDAYYKVPASWCGGYQNGY